MTARTIPLLLAATILAATLPSLACVEKVQPCDEVAHLVDIYGQDCPALGSWATECASNLALLLPEDRQDFDWCVDCFVQLDSDQDIDCSQAPLGSGCPELLSSTLDATCTWPVPVQ